MIEGAPAAATGSASERSFSTREPSQAPSSPTNTRVAPMIPRAKPEDAASVAYPAAAPSRYIRRKVKPPDPTASQPTARIWV